LDLKKAGILQKSSVPDLPGQRQKISVGEIVFQQPRVGVEKVRARNVFLAGIIAAAEFFLLTSARW